MGSKKRSAKAKKRAAFQASLSAWDADDDPFAREDARKQARAEDHEAAQRKKACESKNRYASCYEAELTAQECAEHGAPPLSVYQCPYCNGWHLTSKPWK